MPCFRIQDFGQDGGEALRAMDPKFSLFLKNVNEALNLHLTLPSGVEVRVKADLTISADAYVVVPCIRYYPYIGS